MTFIRNNNATNIDNLYESIFYRYYDLVFVYLSYRIKNRDDIMDVLQDVFVHLWYKGAIHKVEKPEAIIFNTCKQKVAEFYRKTKKKPYSVDLQMDFLDPESDVADDENQYEINLKLVQEGIEMLPKTRKEILILNKVEGVSQQEIANRFNMSRSAVENQISKAIIFLKNKYTNS